MDKKILFSMIKSRFLALLILTLLSSCSGLEHSEQEKVKERNAHKEVIYRNHNDKNYALDIPVKRVREAYPWEASQGAQFPRITKEFFRCKGSSSHPPMIKDVASHETLYDCGGILKHSLPVRGGKEFIYPILLDILNYLQMKTSHKVVITCGHRCPTHNTYSDASISNQASKHMLGAEVDFFIEGMEKFPEKIVDMIIGYFQEIEPYKGKKEYEKFLRLESHLTNVIIPPWYNKEILIKVYQKNEGRDFDNKHSYPYLCLQVRFDREKQEKVIYSWDKAFKGFLRY